MRSATLKGLGRDRDYLSWIHEQPCAVYSVDRLFSKCGGRITAHHAGEHGLSVKASDRTAIALCQLHHQDGPHAVHRLGVKFWSFHGLDRDELIAKLNHKFNEEHNEANF